MKIKKWFRFVAIVIGASALLAIGAFVYYMIATPIKVILNTEDQYSILKALVRISDTRIPRLACEINGTTKGQDGTSIYNDVKVGDFIASYLGWGFNPGIKAFQGLECEGMGLLQCQWSFGQSKASEGWGRILEFEYDPKNIVINPNSLKCIDVP